MRLSAQPKIIIEFITTRVLSHETAAEAAESDCIRPTGNVCLRLFLVVMYKGSISSMMLIHLSPATHLTQPSKWPADIKTELRGVEVPRNSTLTFIMIMDTAMMLVG